jgi:hypothetical protein
MSSPEFQVTDLQFPAGVEVTVRDETVAYGYNNIFHVRLRVSLRIPGAPVAHQRLLEKMGVYQERLDSAKHELLSAYREQIAPYLERPEFASRLTDHLRRQLQPVRRATGYA